MGGPLAPLRKDTKGYRDSIISIQRCPCKTHPHCMHCYENVADDTMTHQDGKADSGSETPHAQIWKGTSQKGWNTELKGDYELVGYGVWKEIFSFIFPFKSSVKLIFLTNGFMSIRSWGWWWQGKTYRSAMCGVFVCHTCINASRYGWTDVGQSQF